MNPTPPPDRLEAMEVKVRLLIVAALFQLVATCGAGGFMLYLAISATPATVSQTNEGNNSTVNVAPPKTEAERILDADPETLSTQELATVEGVDPRTVLNYIRAEDGGTFYTDRHGYRWRALKVGKSWRIQNPFRKNSE